MAKADWTITGSGGVGVVDYGGSMRCQLTTSKLMLWNGRNNLTDSEIIAEIRMGNNSNTRGGLILRSNELASDCYRLRIYGARIYYIDKIVSGILTSLSSVSSAQPWNIFVKTRFRVDGHQLSVEEYTGGQWNLIDVVEDTEKSHASGYAGLVGISVTGYSLMFDNVEISEK